MNQTWENSEKPNLGPDFDPWPKFGPPEFSSWGFTFTRRYTLSQAIIVCNLKENLWSKLKKMGKKAHFGSDLGPLGPNSGRKILFSNLTLSVTRYHGQLSPCTISEKN